MQGKWAKARRHNGAEVDRLQLAVAVLVKPILVGSGGEMEDFMELNLIGRSPVSPYALKPIGGLVISWASDLIREGGCRKEAFRADSVIPII